VWDGVAVWTELASADGDVPSAGDALADSDAAGNTSADGDADGDDDDIPANNDASVNTESSSNNVYEATTADDDLAISTDFSPSSASDNQVFAMLAISLGPLGFYSLVRTV
jgi:hypothetical protein